MGKSYFVGLPKNERKELHFGLYHRHFAALVQDSEGIPGKSSLPVKRD